MEIHGDFLTIVFKNEHKIDLCVTDPPYNIGYKDWDNNNNIFVEQYLTKIYNLLDTNGTLWLFSHPKVVIDVIQIAKKVGFIFHEENWAIWARQKGRGSSKHLKSSREDVLHFTKLSNYTWNNINTLREVIAPYKIDGRPRGWFINSDGDRVRWTGMGNVWPYSSPSWSSKFPDEQCHPAQKPFMLLHRLILLSSKVGDTVFDPFMGSGTTGIATLCEDRKFIGIEKDLTYYKLAKSRLAKTSEFKNSDNFLTYKNKYKILRRQCIVEEV